MKKTVKDATIEKLYPILSEARLSKLNAAGRRAVFDVLYESKKILAEFDNYKGELYKSLVPADYEDTARVIGEFNALPDGKKSAALREKRFADAIKANGEFNMELQRGFDSRESEVGFAPLSDDVFDALCDSNPEWTAGQCVELKDLLCEEFKSKVEPDAEES